MLLRESVTGRHLVGMDWIRLGNTCFGTVIHSWSAWNSCSCRCAGSFTLPQTRLSNSFQTCWVGQDKKPGTSLDIVAVTGKKLRSVAGCIRSGVVVLKHSTRGSQKDDDEWMHGFSTVSCTFRASWTCSTRGASIHCSCMHMCVSCPRHCRRSGWQPSQRERFATVSCPCLGVAQQLLILEGDASLQ